MQNLLLPSWGNRPRDGVDLPVAALWLVVLVAGTMVLQPSWDSLSTHRRLARVHLGDRVHPPPTRTGLPEHTALTLSRFGAGASRGGGVRAKLWGIVTGGNALSFSY